MLARLELGQQLFDGPLHLRELLYELRTIHHRVITRYATLWRILAHWACEAARSSH
jgi:hypothetical protein